MCAWSSYVSVTSELQPEGSLVHTCTQTTADWLYAALVLHCTCSCPELRTCAAASNCHGDNMSLQHDSMWSSIACCLVLQPPVMMLGPACWQAGIIEHTLRRACFASTAVMRLNLSLLTPVGNLMGMPSLPCSQHQHHQDHISEDMTQPHIPKWHFHVVMHHDSITAPCTQTQDTC